MITDIGTLKVTVGGVTHESRGAAVALTLGGPSITPGKMADALTAAFEAEFYAAVGDGLLTYHEPRIEVSADAGGLTLTDVTSQPYTVEPERQAELEARLAAAMRREFRTTSD